MNKIAKIIVFGLLLWLIPFLAGFPFIDAEGNLRISETFFKSIMIVIGGGVGVVLAVNYFKHVTNKYVCEGILLGIIWFIINIAIDVVMVIIEFFPMTLYNYFTDIGLRYLIMPIYTIGLGYALEQRK